ncbi:hypothetical protein Lalb_Chr11g0070431 [Lupinus albus]|uniref:Uncharacterized protein n=1 Tax=Lupinus albus TaxID=3870 RepID=A0A6A4PS25_LUPAL|nr:hypothetical protein Lalb_Chr11g0070431 [Lupinus albus]
MAGLHRPGSSNSSSSYFHHPSSISPHFPSEQSHPDCSSLLFPQSHSLSFPYFHNSKFNSNFFFLSLLFGTNCPSFTFFHYSSYLKPKVCITTNTSSSLSIVCFCPWWLSL